jgi:hypothetical protein
MFSGRRINLQGPSKEADVRPRKRTCAVQTVMSALGQERRFANDPWRQEGHLVSQRLNSALIRRQPEFPSGCEVALLFQAGSRTRFHSNPLDETQPSWPFHSTKQN